MIIYLNQLVCFCSVTNEALDLNSSWNKIFNQQQRDFIQQTVHVLCGLRGCNEQGGGQIRTGGERILLNGAELVSDPAVSQNGPLPNATFLSSSHSIEDKEVGDKITSPWLNV